MGSFIPDPYKALNLPHSATLAQIKQAYRQLARKHHPDTWSAPCFSDADRQEATAKFTAISNAYALLTDERQKADYDRTYNLGGYREEEDPAPPAATSRNSTNTNTANNTGTGRTPTPNTRPNNHNPPPPPPPPSAPPPITTISTGCWVSAIDPRTRRTYYYNKATGERSWSLTPTNKQPHHVSDSDYHRMYGNPQQQSDADAPNTNHHACQCESYTALFLCPPLGIIAVYHSIMAHRCYQRGEYIESRKHARLAPQYACWAICLGICFWLYWFLVRGNDDLFDWDMDWNELWGDGGP